MKWCWLILIVWLEYIDALWNKNYQAVKPV